MKNRRFLTQNQFHKKASETSNSFAFKQKRTFYSDNPERRLKSQSVLQTMKKKDGYHPPQFYFDKNVRRTYCKSVVDKFFNQKQSSRIHSRYIKKSTVNNFYDYEMNSGSKLGSRQEMNRYHTEQRKQEELIIVSLPQIQEMKPKQRKVKSAARRSLTMPDMDLQFAEDTQILSNKFRNFRISKDHRDPDFQFSLGRTTKDIQEKVLGKKEQELLDRVMNMGVKIYENGGYQIISLQYEGMRLKLKKFKETVLGEQLKGRNEKIMRDFGINTIWRKSEYPGFLETSSLMSLRQQLFSIRKKESFIEPVEKQIIISPKKIYNSLFFNKCEYLRDIIVCVAKALLKVKDKAIFMQISLDNLHFMEEKDYRFSDLGSSSLKREFGTAENKTHFYNNPLIQDHDGNYILHPQYIPPEILNMIINQQINGDSLSQLNWESWSLGLIIYQIFALIPVWMPLQAHVYHQTPARGILYEHSRTFKGILQKQLKIPFLISKWLKKNSRSNAGGEQLLNLMKDMLALDPLKRPSLLQIINILSN